MYPTNVLILQFHRLTISAVAIGQVNTMGKALQEKCIDGRTSMIARCYKGREEDCSPVLEDSRFAGESFSKEGSPETDPSPGGGQPLNEV